MNNKIYGYILLDDEMRIQETRSQAIYEDTLDAKLLAAINNWTYVPLSIVELIEELSQVKIFE